MSTYHFVIAKYKEDISWLDGFIDANNSTYCTTYVYDKSGVCNISAGKRPRVHHETLTNIGREAETYLHHICKYYNDLPDALVLLQGNPFDHTMLSVMNVTLPHPKHVIDDVVPFYSQNAITEVHKENQWASVFSLPVVKKCRQYFGRTQYEFQFAPGAQYIVKRKAVLSRPLSFYTMLLEHMRTLDAPQITPYSDNVLDAWTIERLWPSIFGSTTDLNEAQQRYLQCTKCKNM